MTNLQAKPSNLLSRFEAGDCPTQPGIDITKSNILDGSVQGTYQNKAYVTNNNPDLNNTPKDAVVVTNKEKIAYVQKQGYQTESFMDADEIIDVRDARYEKAKSGKVNTTYNIKNISATMAKAGAIGCVVGLTTEALLSYRSWKEGVLSDEQYFKEILKSGGDAGITASITSGIMIPVSATITAMGASTLLTFPVAFAVGAAVNKVVAPCFGRGKYREILNNVRYYQNIENVYDDLLQSIDSAARHYSGFIKGVQQQAVIHSAIEQRSREMNQQLKSLYDSI